MPQTITRWLIPIIGLLSLVVLFLFPRIPQDITFHQFAPLGEVPNPGNVLSNLPFVLIGIYGLLLVARTPVSAAPTSLFPDQPRLSSGIRLTYWVLFAGVFLTGLGSAYYHWHPDNDRLVWDRIPMTIVFMSFLAATVAAVVNRRLGARLLWPLVILGIASVCIWHYTETIQKGDLRLYFWVQYFPMLAIILLLALYYSPAVKKMLPALIWIVAWYGIAKLLERLDYPIYHAIGVSGHTLKHLAAAVSTWYFVQLFRIQYIPPQN